MQDKSAVSSPPRDKVVSAQNADEVIARLIPVSASCSHDFRMQRYLAIHDSYRKGNIGI